MFMKYIILENKRCLTNDIENNVMKPSRNISRLLEIMAALRNPQTGCPWDIV